MSDSYAESYAQRYAGGGKSLRGVPVRSSTSPPKAKSPSKSRDSTGMRSSVGHASDLEAKVLELAKLLKNHQTIAEENDANHRQMEQQLSGRVAQLEQLLQQQYDGKAGSELPVVKALLDKVTALEQQLVDGLQENRLVHQHNAQVVMSADERIARLEQELAEKNLAQLSQLRGVVEELVVPCVQRHVDAAMGQQLHDRVAAALHHAGCNSLQSDVNEQLDQRIMKFEELLHKSIQDLGSIHQSAEAGRPDAAPDSAAEPRTAQQGHQLSGLKLQVEVLQQQVDSIRSNAVDKKAVYHLLKYMEVVSSMHVSMQLAVDQLQATCPGLSLPVASFPAGSSQQEDPQMHGTLLQAQRVEALAKQISEQLGKARGVTSIVHRKFSHLGSNTLSSNKDRWPQGGLDAAIAATAQHAAQTVLCTPALEALGGTSAPTSDNGAPSAEHRSSSTAGHSFDHLVQDAQAALAKFSTALRSLQSSHMLATRDADASSNDQERGTIYPGASFSDGPLPSSVSITSVLADAQDIESSHPAPADETKDSAPAADVRKSSTSYGTNPEELLPILLKNKSAVCKRDKKVMIISPMTGSVTHTRVSPLPGREKKGRLGGSRSASVSQSFDSTGAKQDHASKSDEQRLRRDRLSHMVAELTGKAQR